MIEVNKIYNADCMDILKQLPDKCIDLVVTSPPYWKGFEYEAYFNVFGYCSFNGDGLHKVGYTANPYVTR